MRKPDAEIDRLAADAADGLRGKNPALVGFKLTAMCAVVVGAQVRLCSRCVWHGVLLSGHEKSTSDEMLAVYLRLCRFVVDVYVREDFARVIAESGDDLRKILIDRIEAQAVLHTEPHCFIQAFTVPASPENHCAAMLLPLPEHCDQCGVRLAVDFQCAVEIDCYNHVGVPFWA